MKFLAALAKIVADQSQEHTQKKYSCIKSGTFLSQQYMKQAIKADCMRVSNDKHD